MDLLDALETEAEQERIRSEEALEEAMLSHWRSDLMEVERRRIVPDWIGEPKPLPKDKATFLNMILRDGFVTWTASPSRNNRMIARAMGYVDREKQGTAEDNIFGVNDDVNIVAAAAAAIKNLVDDGMVKGVVGRNGDTEYEMLTPGEYALEDWILENELENEGVF